MKKTIRVFEAFAGYGSQAMALKRLEHNFPDKVHFDFVGISEIDKYAIAAYRAVHGDVPNYGDITKINWGGANA
jgi:DNA (cytosine-5)-methyltransferase 1